MTETVDRPLARDAALPATAGIDDLAPVDAVETPRMPYVPAIDGLRALAVLAVLLYHVDVSWLPGGFLGVEVFFAVSGYLITALLLGELHRDRRIDLTSFYVRRGRRLLPTLYATLAGVGAWVVLFDADELARFGREALAAIGYVSNWFLILREESYFDAFGRPSPLRHLWSLAIEEQFYLVWPLVFGFLMLRLGRRWTLGITLAAAAGSAVLMVVLFDPLADPSRVYYGTDTRAAGLLLGAAVAMVWRPWERLVHLRDAFRLSALGLVALGGLGWIIADYGEFTARTYRFGFLIVSALTLVAVAAVATPGAWLARPLGWEPLRLVGVRSYALYLVHWPVVVYTRPGIDLDWSWWQVLVLRIVLVVALTELVHRLVEVPLRRGALTRPSVFGRGFGRALVLRGMRWGGPVVIGLVVLAASGAMVLALQRNDEVDPSVPVSAIGAFTSEEPTDDGGATVTAATAGEDTEVVIDEPATPTTAAPGDDPTPTTETAGPDEDGGPATTAAPSTEAPVDAAPGAVPAAAISRPGVLVIGDSVALGAVDELEARFDGGVVVDAVVSRQMKHAVDVLDAYRAAGAAPGAVVVHLGTNGPFTDDELDRVVGAIGPETVGVVVTSRVPRPWESRVNDALRDAVGRHPTLRIVDWNAVVGSNPAWVGTDGTHLTSSGAEGYAQVLATALPDLPAPPAPSTAPPATDAPPTTPAPADTSEPADTTGPAPEDTTGPAAEDTEVDTGEVEPVETTAPAPDDASTSTAPVEEPGE